MLEELFDWIVALMPFRVFLAVCAGAVVVVAALIIWATYG
jgi:hypothetical protein